MFSILSRIAFLNNLPLRVKINATVGVTFLVMVVLMTTLNVRRESDRMMELVTDQAQEVSSLYFDSLNMMMLTNSMAQRGILRRKMLNREGVVEARVIRGDPVKAQFGPGMPDEQAMDALDQQALRGQAITRVMTVDDKRVITVITPFHATKNTRGVNCLRCHSVEPDAVNGAVRVSISLDKVDKSARAELWRSVLGNLAFLALGLMLVHLLLKYWITIPLSELMRVLKRRAGGDQQTRVAVAGHDEVGRLGMAFNDMAESMDAAAEREREQMAREQEAATALRSKVDHLLQVVNRVAAGDFSVQVEISGSDAIAELAHQLQGMIVYINNSIEEKRVSVETLKQQVDRILTVVTQAAEGDLTGRIDMEGDDTVGQLAKGVQRMIDNLNGLVTQVQHSGIQLASSTTAIAATAKEQEATVAEQTATTHEIVATATEISATAKELVKTMDEVVRVAEGAAQSANHSKSGLAQMEETMRQVVEASKSISSKFEVLNEKAANISTVVTTITKVADQTNLLSLNAAIEAEKAGEYGFGFAVVAREIRRLADQTAVATLDIEQMVKEMQSAVSAGVMSMEKFSDQLRRSVTDVSQVGTQLNQIIEEVQALTPRFDNVHQGMLFQSQGAQQINQSMIQLSDAAQQTLESLRDSNGALERLNEAARDLQSGVTRFKVGR